MTGQPTPARPDQRLAKIASKNPARLGRRDLAYLAELRLRHEDTERFGPEIAEQRAQARQDEYRAQKAARPDPDVAAARGEQGKGARRSQRRQQEVAAGREIADEMVSMSQREREVWLARRPGDKDAIYGRLPGSFEGGKRR